MNWTVGWEPSVRSEMHQLWAISPDPAAVRSAAETVERNLASDPTGSGQHLSEGLWRIVVAPLVVHYTIDTARRHVEITDCALVRDLP